MSFNQVLSNAGRSFLRAFVASIIVFAPGIAQAPNLDQARALGVAALVASLAAGLRTLQDFVPALQFDFTWQGWPVGDFLGSFTRAFLGAFLVAVIGMLSAPEVSFGGSVVVGLLTGAFAAGILAVQKFVEQKPVPQAGQ